MGSWFSKSEAPAPAPTPAPAKKRGRAAPALLGSAARAAKRRKTKSSEQSDCEILADGVVVFRRVLTEHEQQTVLADVFSRLNLNTDMHSVAMPGHPSPSLGFAYAYRQYYANTGTEPLCIALARDRYAEFAVEKASEIQKQNESETDAALRLPTNFKSASLWARCYEEGHKLGNGVLAAIVSHSAKATMWTGQETTLSTSSTSAGQRRWRCSRRSQAKAIYCCQT